MWNSPQRAGIQQSIGMDFVVCRNTRCVTVKSVKDCFCFANLSFLPPPSFVWRASDCTHLSISTNTSDWDWCGVYEMQYSIWKTSVCEGDLPHRFSPRDHKKPLHRERHFCPTWFQPHKAFGNYQQERLRPCGWSFIQCNIWKRRICSVLVLCEMQYGYDFPQTRRFSTS